MAPSPDDLLRSGPLLLFLMAVAETAVPAGLVVPAGVALATGAFLAHQGLLGWEVVVPASMAGALVGDSVGYWLGRSGSPFLQRTLRRSPERVQRLARGAGERTRRLFAHHALVAVTGGRLVAFVRTFMPATAGGSGMTYLRFLAFDVPGVVGWAALYVAIGLGAGEGWRAVSGEAGPGLAAVLAVLVVLGAVALKVRVRRKAGTTAADGSAGGTGSPGGEGAP
jgi:membrane-associated protein